MDLTFFDRQMQVTYRTIAVVFALFAGIVIAFYVVCNQQSKQSNPHMRPTAQSMGKRVRWAEPVVQDVVEAETEYMEPANYDADDVAYENYE